MVKKISKRSKTKTTLKKGRHNKSKNIAAGVGISKNNDAYKAGKEAVEMAIKKVGKAPEFGLVFCSGTKFKDRGNITALVKGVHEAFIAANPKCKWAGCTTAGELSQYGATHGSVTVMAISSDYVKFGIGVGQNVSKNAKAAGKLATKTALKNIKIDKEMDSYLQYIRTKKYDSEHLLKMNPYSIILLAKGPVKGLIPGIPKMYDLEASLEGVFEVMGQQIPIVGGGSFDEWEMKQNYHFADGKVYDEAIIVIMLLSNLYFASGLAHGYKPSGIGMLVTESKRSGKSFAVSKLNNQNAFTAYAKTLKFNKKKFKGTDIMKQSIHHPFGLVDPFGETWIRVPGITFGEKLIFGCNMKEGTNLALMNGKDDDIFKAYKNAVDKALKKIKKKKPAAVLVFSCAIRNKYLGSRKIGKEIDLFKKYFKNVPFIGFYTFSEFGGTSGYRMGIHNQSVTVLVLTEDLMA